jgi:hypothetical protein
MDIEAHKIKWLRGCLVEGLRSFYPNGISGALILRTILGPRFRNLTWEDLIPQLDYLAERGLIERIENEFPKPRSDRDRLFRLTFRGYDVACGVVDDDSIGLGA